MAGKTVNKGSLTNDDILFPVPKAFRTQHVDVGDGHSLFVQQFGNPDGVPVLLVHGGPGGGIDADSTDPRSHDPHFFRIIAVDQRGCGKSRPHITKDRKKALYRNNPDALASDFEIIRKSLGIESWHVYGVSWGSCLSVYYASLFPKQVKSLTVGGVWMHTPQEIDWYINRMGLFHPEAEQALLKTLPKNVKRFDRLDPLYKAIIGQDKHKAFEVGAAQGNFEMAALFFSFQDSKTKTEKPLSRAEKAKEKRDTIAIGSLEIFFMKKHPLPTNWYKTAKVKRALKSIPFRIFQGRYDIICPPAMAYDLHTAHPHSELTMVHYAGHRREGDMLQIIMKSNDELKRI